MVRVLPSRIIPGSGKVTKSVRSQKMTWERSSSPLKRPARFVKNRMTATIISALGPGSGLGAPCMVRTPKRLISSAICAQTGTVR